MKLFSSASSSALSSSSSPSIIQCIRHRLIGVFVVVIATAFSFAVVTIAAIMDSSKDDNNHLVPQSFIDAKHRHPEAFEIAIGDEDNVVDLKSNDEVMVSPKEHETWRSFQRRLLDQNHDVKGLSIDWGRIETMFGDPQRCFSPYRRLYYPETKRGTGKLS